VYLVGIYSPLIVEVIAKLGKNFIFSSFENL
jgi:hypothetical protein